MISITKLAMVGLHCHPVTPRAGECIHSIWTH